MLTIDRRSIVDKESGLIFLNLYDATTANLAMFPRGFSSTDIEYRGYVIHIFPFGNYNMFFVIDEENRRIIVLRVLYQKQNWKRILRVDDPYHVNGKPIPQQ